VNSDDDEEEAEEELDDELEEQGLYRGKDHFIVPFHYLKGEQAPIIACSLSIHWHP